MENLSCRVRRPSPAPREAQVPCVSSWLLPTLFLVLGACDDPQGSGGCRDGGACPGEPVCERSVERCDPPDAVPVDARDAGPPMDAGQDTATSPVDAVPHPDAGTPEPLDVGSEAMPDEGLGGGAGVNAPLSASAYQSIMGRGLAASWFKQAPVTGYSIDALSDFRERGFDNIRLRVAEEIFVGDAFSVVEDAIDDCIEVGLVPVISWVDHEAERSGSNADRQEFVAWWSDLATRLRGRSHTIGFNLFTEIGNGTALDDIDVYNDWTSAAVRAIRAIDPERIIILSAPSKTVETLTDIDPTIYAGDDYILAEWHLYASGPNQDGGHKNWVGEGSDGDRQNVRSIVRKARRFTEATGVPTYFGAWMPMDNNGASLEQAEVEAFARYFLERLSGDGIPWTVNAVQHFYDTATNTWLETRSWGELTLQMPRIVDILVNHADFGEGVSGLP